MTADTGNDSDRLKYGRLYMHYLGSRKGYYGLPLWNPEPFDSYNAVAVGDVGYILDGQFRLLFRAAIPQGDRVPGHDVPEDFTPLNAGIPLIQIERDPQIFASHASTPVASKGLMQEWVDDFGSRALPPIRTFPPGAVLQTGEYSEVYKTLNDKGYKRYLKKNCKSWMKLAASRGLDIIPEELILVTGCYLTDSYTILVSPSTDEESHIGLRLPQRNRRSSIVQAGRPGGGLADLSCRYCVFLQGLSVSRRWIRLPLNQTASIDPTGGHLRWSTIIFAPVQQQPIRSNKVVKQLQTEILSQVRPSKHRLSVIATYPIPNAENSASHQHFTIAFKLQQSDAIVANGDLLANEAQIDQDPDVHATPVDPVESPLEDETIYQRLIDDMWEGLTHEAARDSIHEKRYRAIRMAAKHLVIPRAVLIQDKVTIQAEDALYVRGTFSKVYYGLLQGQAVAIKCPTVPQTSGPLEAAEFRKMMYRESLLGVGLTHKHVLPFIGVTIITFPGIPCMVTPWMVNGPLRSFSEKVLKEQMLSDFDFSAAAYRWLVEIALGLQYLHAEHIAHGDLHCGNILVASDGTLRLSDFGLSVMTDGALHENESIHSIHGGGAEHWKAPELFGLGHSLSRRPTFHSDIYSFGCVVYEIYARRPPFSHISGYHLAKTVAVRKRRAPRPQLPGGSLISDDLWSIISGSLSYQPSDRLSITTILDKLAGIAVTPPGASSGI
ncbi:Leucine-rich repeat serine/threonine-protein kinase 2 [Steccherinum ochraceum]|uniref:Leucine-rich repeat serine/threonine-protein kinase 2 n=1 Tax=Steccherinum ochraceum TaxID=92696 RepID=A0A4R0RHM4_9APHY|nr:Leucine-rich repeat serine/threonine-protein kinase 2 [Steccherinum ochraceum]